MNLRKEALTKLRGLLEEARRRRIPDAGAAALATVDSRARPSVRTIYIMLGGDDELIFFTHRDSGKARHLAHNRHVGLVFYWPAMQAQVEADGEAHLASDDVAREFWYRRPHESRLAAWVSHQSERTADDRLSPDRLNRQRRAFDFQPIPMPPNWCAFELRLTRIEFWQGGWQRLHTRTRYLMGEDGIWSRDHYEP